MKNEVVIYCRVSTEEQVEKSSLDVQRRECRAKAQVLGCTVLKEFIEEGVSGAIQDRPAMTAMMQYCALHRSKIKYIIVKAVDRFARDTLVYLNLRQYFRELGIELESVNQAGLSDGTATSQFLEGIFSNVAQLERATILERTQKGTKEVILKGGWTAKAPYGYRSYRTSDGLPTLAIEKSEAKNVVKIFELLASGQNRREIADYLNTFGIKSPRGGKWSAQTIDNIVHNSVYVAKIENRNFPDRLLDAAHVGIVTAALWNQVQKQFKGKTSASRLRFNPKFPLTSILHCPECRGRMTGSNSKNKAGKKYAYYHCCKAGCRSKNLNRDLMEKRFGLLLHDIKPTAEGVRILEREMQNVWFQKWSAQIEERKQLRTRLTTLELKREKIEEKFIMSQILEDAHQRHLTKVNIEIVQVNDKLETLMITENRIKELLIFLRRFLTSISNTWKNATPEQKRLLQKFVFPMGLRCEPDGTYRTLALPPLLELSRGSVPANSNVVALRRIELLLQE